MSPPRSRESNSGAKPFVLSTPPRPVARYSSPTPESESTAKMAGNSFFSPPPPPCHSNLSLKGESNPSDVDIQFEINSGRSILNPKMSDAPKITLPPWQEPLHHGAGPHTSGSSMILVSPTSPDFGTPFSSSMGGDTTDFDDDEDIDVDMPPMPTPIRLAMRCTRPRSPISIAPKASGGFFRNDFVPISSESNHQGHDHVARRNSQDEG